MFQWKDIFAPISPCLLMTLVPLYAALISTTPLPARIICVLLAIVSTGFCITWYVIRYKSKPTFTSKHGIEIFVGKTNAPNCEMIERWTLLLIAKWETYLRNNHPDFNVGERLKHAILVFSDIIDIKAIGFTRLVRGWAKGNYAVIGAANPQSLFYHELSHVLLWGVVQTSRHHELFKMFKIDEVQP